MGDFPYLYHYNCLLEWTPRTCPLCRADWKGFGKRRKRRSKRRESVEANGQK